MSDRGTELRLCGDPIEPSIIVKAAHYFTPVCGPLSKGAPIILAAGGMVFGGPAASAGGFAFGSKIAAYGVGVCPAIGAIGNESQPGLGETPTS